MSAPDAALRIDALTVALPPGADRAYAIDALSLHLHAGEILCVVGESGSGKSMTAGAVMRLLPAGVRATHGRILFHDRDLLALPDADMRAVRGRSIAMVFQEPMTALNPLRTIGAQIAETFRIHTTLSRRQIDARCEALLAEVGLPQPAAIASAWPHELSGGQRQRAMIAMALALEPEVLIADEPTTALDVTTQAQVLDLIAGLQARRGTAVLFITHDFGVVAQIADRVAVMHRGVLVEHGPARQVLDAPQHPYTQALIAAVPPLEPPPRVRRPDDALLVVRDVDKTYRSGGGFGRGAARSTHALDAVSLTVPRGGTLGIVGESGSGKSTLARCIVGLVRPDAGSIRLDGTGLSPWPRSRAAARAARSQVQMVFQDPYASLNPRRRAGELVAQGPMVHGMPRAQALARARELFELVGLDADAMNRFPHEFSGGQRQRIGLARALALRPALLVADEPVSALDVSVQARVLELLSGLRQRLGLSMLFVTHDLRVAAQICDDVAVMQSGRVVEHGPVDEVLLRPCHPYTRALLDAVPGRAWSAARASGLPVHREPASPPPGNS